MNRRFPSLRGRATRGGGQRRASLPTDPVGFVGSSLWTWVDAQNVTLDSNSKIDTWTDLGPNGNDFTQSDLAKRMALGTLDGGEAAMDGATGPGNGFYRLATPSGTPPSNAAGCTVYCVFNTPAAVKWLFAIGDSSGASGTGPHVLTLTGTPEKLISRYVATTGQTTTAEAAAGDDHVLEYILAPGGDSHTIATDFSAPVTGSHNGSIGAFDQVVLANRNSVDSQQTSALIAELIVVSRAVSPAESAFFQTYFRSKYSTLGALP